MTDLAAALDDAVARNELEAWFQPQIDLATGAIVGAEALCRWQHPRLGWIEPAEFIPLAERSGAIHALGRFMAQAGCDAFREWSAYRPIDVSVNVSPLQLDGSAFTDWLAKLLAPMKLRQNSYMVEVTETQPISDVPAVVKRLDDLHGVGARVSIDDFGAGQASLAQLRRLHGAELKVDRSLVIDESADNHAFLVDVVKAAHGSGVRVVAEGIETHSQLARVRELGFDRAQGYLLGRPMPRSELTRLLRAS